VEVREAPAEAARTQAEAAAPMALARPVALPAWAARRPLEAFPLPDRRRSFRSEPSRV